MLLLPLFPEAPLAQEGERAGGSALLFSHVCSDESLCQVPNESYFETASHSVLPLLLETVLLLHIIENPTTSFPILFVCTVQNGKRTGIDSPEAKCLTTSL